MTKLQFKANKNTVTANAYVPHVMYKSNEAIVEKLGGTIVKGAGLFTAEFPNAAKAKAFVEQAVTSISKREYNASRKSEPKVAEKPTVAKGKGKSQKQAVTKGKGSTAGCFQTFIVFKKSHSYSVNNWPESKHKQ